MRQLIAYRAYRNERAPLTVATLGKDSNGVIVDFDSVDLPSEANALCKVFEEADML
jgi:hypothetical protein